MSNRPIGQSHEPFSPQKKPYVWEDHSKRETSKIPIQSRDFEVWVNFLENFKSKLRQLRVLCLSSYKHFWDPLSTPDHIKKKNLWELNPLENFFFSLIFTFWHEIWNNPTSLWPYCERSQQFYCFYGLCMGVGTFDITGLTW